MRVGLLTPILRLRKEALVRARLACPELSSDAGVMPCPWPAIVSNQSDDSSARNSPPLGNAGQKRHRRWAKTPWNECLYATSSLSLLCQCRSCS
eukprot:1363044-Pleurochrysis_carterae.AAC.2